MVVYVLNENLQHGRTIKMWHGDFGKAPPFDIGPDALFVAYSAWAEMTCFLTLGWKFPEHIFDLHTAYLAASNILLPYNPDEVRKRQEKGLAAACRAYDIEGWENIDKKAIAKAIGEGRWREYGREAVFDYCEEDVRMRQNCCANNCGAGHNSTGQRRAHTALVELQRQERLQKIQARGMPIDTLLWNTVQENKAAVIARTGAEI